MKIKTLLKIQSEVEERATPSDVLSLLNLVYYSKSKMELINIGEMHLTHFVRVFAKMLESNDSPLQDQIDKIKNRLEEIEKEKQNGYTN